MGNKTIMCYKHDDIPAISFCIHCGMPFCDSCHTGKFCNICIENPPKRKSDVLSLAFFLGWCGAHRYKMKFYTTGVIYTLTFGVFYIGWILDVLRILFFSTISRKKIPVFDFNAYETIGIKTNNDSLVGSFFSDVVGATILDNMSNDNIIKSIITKRGYLWRDNFGRPLLRIDRLWANFFEGVEFYNKEKYINAIKIFNRIIKMEPQGDLAYFFRGRSYAFMNEPENEKALSDFTRAIELNPCSLYYGERGSLFLCMFMISEARSDIEMALQLNPNNDDAKFYLEELDKSEKKTEA